MSFPEHRQPWHLLIAKDRTKERGNILPPNHDVKFDYWESNYWDRNYYTFQKVNSNLLIAIDDDDVPSVERALIKDRINVNSLYMIPSWEVPDSAGPQLQTFLHRALWEKSANVFEFLLQKGANPRIKGHCHDTVIDDLFNYTSGEDTLKFGKMLIDAGVKGDEIQGFSRWKEYKSNVDKLIRYANSKKKKIVRQRKRVPTPKFDHIRN